MATTTDIMDPVFDTIRTGQDVCMKTVRSWAEFGQRFWPSFFSGSSGEQSASPAEMLDTSFDFARKCLDVQEEFSRAMWAAAEPMLGLRKAEEEPIRGRATKAVPAEKSAG